MRKTHNSGSKVSRVLPKRTGSIRDGQVKEPRGFSEEPTESLRSQKNKTEQIKVWSAYRRRGKETTPFWFCVGVCVCVWYLRRAGGGGGMMERPLKKKKRRRREYWASSEDLPSTPATLNSQKRERDRESEEDEEGEKGEISISFSLSPTGPLLLPTEKLDRHTRRRLSSTSGILYGTIYYLRTYTLDIYIYIHNINKRLPSRGHLGVPASIIRHQTNRREQKSTYIASVGKDLTPSLFDAIHHW